MVKYKNPGDSAIAQLFSIVVSFYVHDYANPIQRAVDFNIFIK